MSNYDDYVLTVLDPGTGHILKIQNADFPVAKITLPGRSFLLFQKTIPGILGIYNFDGLKVHATIPVLERMIADLTEDEIKIQDGSVMTFEDQKAILQKILDLANLAPQGVWDVTN